MAVFSYQGTGVRGERLAGEFEAASRSEALRRLATERIQPLSLVAKDGGVAPTPVRTPVATTTVTGKIRVDNHAQGNVRLTNAQVILFTDELSDFLHSGLQLEPALQLMENREEASPVKKVAAYLREKVRDGASFSDALRGASPNFDELYCNLVAAGEISGAMPALLQRQAKHLGEMQELKGRVTLALIYPAALITAGVIAMTVFMTVLVPQMIKLFAKTGSAMPLPTYILVQLSTATHKYGLITAAIIAIAVVAFTAHIRQPAGRMWWDRAKLKTPLIGGLLSATFYAQLCQTLANLLQNGLPLLSALKLVSKATGNVFYRALLLRITELVGEGASFTRAMKSVGYFPPNLRDLVKVGESTGELGGTLEKVGERYEKLIQVRIDRIMSIVPLIIISMLGLMVLLIAWSMLSGIFQVIHGLQGSGTH